MLTDQQPEGPKTIDVTPTWRQAFRILMACLEGGTERGKTAARAEMLRVADHMDHINGHARLEPAAAAVQTAGEADPDVAMRVAAAKVCNAIGDPKLNAAISEVDPVFLTMVGQLEDALHELNADRPLVRIGPGGDFLTDFNPPAARAAQPPKTSGGTRGVGEALDRLG